MPTYLRDNVKSRILRADGSQYRIAPTDGQPRHRVQEELLQVRMGPAPTADALSANGAPKAAEEAAHA